MFQAPIKVVQTLRLDVPAGVFTATAVSTVVFSATPFLIPAVAADRGVTIGLVGMISTTQLGGFVLATTLGPRRFRPRRAIMTAAIVLGIVANLLSAVSPWFALLVAARFLSGLSLGLIAWIAWAEVFGDDQRVGDVAVIGPIIGTIASPLIALVLDRQGPDRLFVVMAALYVVPALFTRGMHLTAARRPAQRRHRPTRGAVAVLVGLSLLTLGGSASFLFVGAIGSDLVGLSPLAVSLAFSANAIAGLPSARYRGERSMPGAWMAMTGIAAFAVCTVHDAIVFWAAMLTWGFAFWMAVPGAFALLASRSRFPDERAGDAQAVMATGRVIGPLVGGGLYEIGPAVLGWVAGATMVLAGVVLLMSERFAPTVAAEPRPA
ncbi:MAG: MFS transporter [Ilumatobacteraceae bacterium]